MSTAGIVGVEAALPERVVTNEELAAAHPDWRMPDVERRTGVLERRLTSLNETALDLGARASGALLDRLAVDRDAVDALIFCTQTPDHVMPPNATLLQSRLGLGSHVAAFDITLACSGYVYALYLGRALIASQAASKVLLVTADTYSKLMSPEDRSTVTLFGDGGAATLLSATTHRGIRLIELGTDGSLAACFTVPAGGARMPRSASTRELRSDRSGNRRSLEHIQMDGPSVLAFVQREIPRNVRGVLQRAALQVSDLDLVVFHQASRVALDYLIKTLGLRPDQVFEDLHYVGNTVSASIPIALRHAEEQGLLRQGSSVLIVGFGVGLSWGTALIEWG